jgi:hypothetical protein
MAGNFFGEYRALFEERQGQFRRSFNAELHGGRENNILVLTKEALLATFSYHEVQVNLFIAKYADSLRSLGGPLMGRRALDTSDHGLVPWHDLLNRITRKCTKKMKVVPISHFVIRHTPRL